MDAQTPKRRYRRDLPATSKVRPNGKVGMNLTVSPDIKRLIQLHALCTGRDDSAVVSELAERHLREWFIVRRPSEG